MDPMWLDRELVDRSVEGIDDRLLKYDPDTGQYCLQGEPFTGVAKTRKPDGRLDGLSHLKDGVECGLSVAWHSNGQIRCYSEMADDVFDGWHFEWDEDGTRRVADRYAAGRKITCPMNG
jgi:antitoxin component YwqK of YwqJK toxin-antitoxin module